MNEALRKLLEEIAKGTEAKKEQLEALAKAVVKAGDDEIVKLQGINLDIIKSRDEFKAKVKEVGTALNIDINTESVTEAIDAIKSKTGVKETEALAVKEKEIEALKTEVQSLTQNIESTKSQSQEQILKVVLERDLAMVLPAHKAHEDMTKYIVKDIESKAHFENGKVVFKNEDGTTIRIDGADATIDDMVLQQKIADKNSRFFDNSVQDSGGDGGQGGNANVSLNGTPKF